MAQNEQVKIRLTDNPEILDSLRVKGCFSRDGSGKEYYSRSFNGQEFRFYRGVPLTVPRAVGLALRSSSEIEVPDKPINPLAEALVVSEIVVDSAPLDAALTE